ncbi:MAG: hypothetical protein ACRDJH_21970 [Thermomicrobiales bacterium]
MLATLLTILIESLDGLRDIAFIEHVRHRIAEWLNLPSIEIDSSGSVSLLSTLVQVAGIFLGLYFAAINFDVGTYAGTSPDVRRILVKELTRNRFVSTIALFGSIATLLLLGSALGWNISIINYVLVTVMGIFSLLSFVRLGIRALAFLDPARLGTGLFHDLTSAIHAVTPAGRFWQQSSFLAFYQRQAESSMRAMNDISELATSRTKWDGGGATSLAALVLAVWRVYGYEKPRIPTSSQWYVQVSRHQDWLLASSTSMSIYLDTGLPLQPEQMSDLLWFDNQVADLTANWTAPEAVRDELPHMMERLAVLSSPVLPSHFFRPLDQAEWNFFDVNGYFSFHELALVHATRSIGWNGRAQFMGDAEKRMLEHYWLRRELMFERFIIEMRQSILDTLNQGLDRVGGHLRGGLRIEVEGLPSMADVDDALRRLMKGNMAFGEIMKPFRR